MGWGTADGQHLEGRVDLCDARADPSYGKSVFAAIAAGDYLRGLDKPAFSERLAHHYGEINALHPFREGNGRSTRAFIAQLAVGAGHRLDYARTGAETWIEAARASFFGDLRPAAALFASIITDEPRPDPVPAPTRAQIHEAFERALDAKSVPTSIRSQLREKLTEELSARTARGELPAEPKVERGKTPMDGSSEITTSSKPKR